LIREAPKVGYWQATADASLGALKLDRSWIKGADIASDGVAEANALHQIDGL
jgi:hypothetical protein